MTVMALALLGYIYFVRRLFYRGLISPILEITDATQRLVDGDLALKLPEYRSDELSGMAQALDIFRKNALELKQKNSDLIKANRDIEDFAYAASHDLKSPLRAIISLAMFLSEDLEGKIDVESNDNLNEIMVRAKRLERLLSDLITYAKSNDLDQEIRTMQIPDFLEEIFSMLNQDNRFKLSIAT